MLLLDDVAIPCDHYPTPDGRSCVHCGERATIVPPDELATALEAAYQAACELVEGQMQWIDP